MNIEELRKETIKKLEDYKEYDELYLHDTIQELANLENVTDWDFEYCADECIAKLQQI